MNPRIKPIIIQLHSLQRIKIKGEWKARIRGDFVDVKDAYCCVSVLKQQPSSVGKGEKEKERALFALRFYIRDQKTLTFIACESSIED
ncbi:hypothetical protein U1Q18_016900 [Sarracenia purpurea var. burkii]